VPGIVTAVVALSVVSLATLALMFALISRVRTLQELVLKNRTQDGLPRPGDPIGRFEVTTTAGEVITDVSLALETTLVGFFMPDCVPCERVQAELRDRQLGVPMVAFIHAAADEASAAAMSDALTRYARVAYAGTEDSVSRAFRTAGYPTLVRIENGLVAAAGHRLSDVLP
jgi:hypothetical protein